MVILTTIKRINPSGSDQLPIILMENDEHPIISWTRLIDPFGLQQQIGRRFLPLERVRPRQRKHYSTIKISFDLKKAFQQELKRFPPFCIQCWSCWNIRCLVGSGSCMLCEKKRLEGLVEELRLLESGFADDYLQLGLVSIGNLV